MRTSQNLEFNGPNVQVMVKIIYVKLKESLPVTTGSSSSSELWASQYEPNPQCSINPWFTRNKIHSVTSCQVQYKTKAVFKYNDANRMEIFKPNAYICLITTVTVFTSERHKQNNKLPFLSLTPMFSFSPLVHPSCSHFIAHSKA